MCGMSTAQFAWEIVEPDRLLGPRREVLDLDVAFDQLVADDDREVRPVAHRCLELLAELPAAELRTSGDASGAKRRRDP